MVYVYLYSLIQIILESVPVSSSGHGILLELILKNTAGHATILSNLLLSCDQPFNHFLHIPTVIVTALFFFYEWYIPWKSLIWYGYQLSVNNSPYVKNRFYMLAQIGKRVITFVIVADVCTVVLYFIMPCFHRFMPPLGMGFALTTGLLFSLRNTHQYVLIKNPLWCAVILGCAQGLALLPGVSRLGITFVTAHFLGYSARRACHIAFLIQWPLMVIGGVKSIFLMHQIQQLFSFSYIGLLVVAACGSYAMLHIFYYTVTHNKVWYFGVYELVPTCIWFILSF